MNLTMLPDKTSEDVAERRRQLQPPTLNIKAYVFPE